MKTKLLPTNIPGLYKDSKTNVVINDNIGDYQRLVALRKRKKADDKMKEEIKSLQNEMKELRKMIKELQNG